VISFKADTNQTRLVVAVKEVDVRAFVVEPQRLQHLLDVGAQRERLVLLPEHRHLHRYQVDRVPFSMRGIAIL
jgi:hypothetical protein